MYSTRLTLGLSLAVAVSAAGCLGEEEEPPPQPATSAEIDRDVCDWWETGDLSVVAADAIVTPAGIAVACEQPGATAHSLLMFDPKTHAKRVVYDTLPVEVGALQLADAETLLLTGRRRELFVVDLAASAPTPQRILDYSTDGGRWIFEPRVVGEEVYYSSTHIEGTVETNTIEKVTLHGGPDQQPVVVAELPSGMNYVVASTEGLHLFGGAYGERAVARLDIATSPATLEMMLQRPRGPYEPMGFHGELADRVLWQDGAKLVELTGTTMTEIEPMACSLDFRARVIGDDIVQVGWISSDPCQGFVAMNAVDGTVRRAPLDARWGGYYEVIGIIGETVYSMDTDIDTTRIVTSPLSRTSW